MAYVSQEQKQETAPIIRAILKEYNMSGTLSVEHNTTLVLTLKSGQLDLLKYSKHNYYDVNQYYIKDTFEGEDKEFLLKIDKALRGPKYFDKSDLQTDYHCVSHYIRIRVGKWNKQYEFKDKREVQFEQLNEELDQKLKNKKIKEKSDIKIKL